MPPDVSSWSACARRDPARPRYTSAEDVRTLATSIALLCFAGCRTDDGQASARLTAAISAAQTPFAAANAEEQALIVRARAWCNAIVAAGAGHDAGLARNTATAVQLSQSAAATAERLDEIRQSLNRVRLRAEDARRVRAELVAQLSRRKTAVEAFHMALDETVSQLRAFAQDRDYSGDTVPDRVRSIDETLGAWPTPEDIFSPALAAMRSQ
jgi:ABC-type transporter Mla subunit MlaD